MWVYRELEKGLYTIGFFDPTGQWYPSEDSTDKRYVEEKVHWLNGGPLGE